MVQQQAVACDGLLLCKLSECLLNQFREVWGGVRNIRNVDIGAEGIPVSAENHSRGQETISNPWSACKKGQSLFGPGALSAEGCRVGINSRSPHSFPGVCSAFSPGPVLSGYYSFWILIGARCPALIASSLEGYRLVGWGSFLFTECFGLGLFQDLPDPTVEDSAVDGAIT